MKVCSEYVFYTIQGEGRLIGQPSIFIRLSGCNLHCSWKNSNGSITPCDTSHASFTPENICKSIDETIKEVEKYPCRNVVITGGEPTIHEELPELVRQLKQRDYFITIETNGTRYVQTQADLISMSPKLRSSTEDPKFGAQQEKLRLNIDSLLSFMQYHQYQLKFVVNTPEDVEEILSIHSKLCIGAKTPEERYILLSLLASNTWLMPQGVTMEQFNEKTQWIIDLCKKHGFNFTERLHIRLWGNKKGV